MKYFFIRTQLLIVSLVLLVTFGLTIAIVVRYNRRWDLTREKAYSIQESTQEILNRLSDLDIEILAFYPQEDASRANFEVFLKQCRMYHPKFIYRFYDPDRVPSLARELRIAEPYTVILRGAGRQERVIGPTEENMSNAFLRLAAPKKFNICFVTGHDETSIKREDRTGLSFFAQVLQDHNYLPREIILTEKSVPADCHVIALTGPHRDLDPTELKNLRVAFNKDAKGVLILIDPMDPGTGVSFINFLREFGVALGADVIVDKMSKMVGGDFLVPLVAQYISKHPITARFEKPTFFPVTRSVQPSTETKEGLEVMPLALSGSGSWAEANLSTLEKGEAAFEVDHDLAGPIPVAVAVEQILKDAKVGGRMVVVGDSDFITNGYLGLSGNLDLSLNMMEWLVKDDRFISIRPRASEFEPFLLNEHQQFKMFALILVGLPFVALALSAGYLILRRRSA